MQKKIFASFIILGMLSTAGAYIAFPLLEFLKSSSHFVFFSAPKRINWEMQAVDTMKYSRDLAREKDGNLEFVQEIEQQTRAIANIGATHVAIATPYNEPFIPFLKLWVDAARKHNLKVWFRGNWSQWEGWFGYPKNMTRREHIASTKEFILKHPELFLDGDIFSSCPECENGGQGDPRQTGDIAAYRKFLIDEYAVSREAFRSIKKDVRANYFSMNADVARLIMDKKTTIELGRIVVIDHYVSTPEKLARDVESISKESGGKVVLGEWGVSIPDLHGNMTETERASWMEKALKNLSSLDNGTLTGMNYWLAKGGTSALWKSNIENSETSNVLKKYYSPQILYGRITDKLGRPLENARLQIGEDEIHSEKSGYFQWRSPEKASEIKAYVEGYEEKTIPIPETSQQIDIALEKEDNDLYYRLMLWMKQ